MSSTNAQLGSMEDIDESLDKLSEYSERHPNETEEEVDQNRNSSQRNSGALLPPQRAGLRYRVLRTLYHHIMDRCKAS